MAPNGVFSLAAAKAHPDLRIVSLEPQPLNFLLLHHNVAVNGLLSRIQVVNRAVTKGTSNVLMGYDRANPGNSKVLRGRDRLGLPG